MAGPYAPPSTGRFCKGLPVKLIVISEEDIFRVRLAASPYVVFKRKMVVPSDAVARTEARCPCSDTVYMHGAPSHVQSLLQPSPSTELPSSQASILAFTPSPQTGAQGAPPPVEHRYPRSTSLQSAAQPSPPTLFPSSHISKASRTPLPHVLLSTSDIGTQTTLKPLPLMQLSAMNFTRAIPLVILIIPDVERSPLSDATKVAL
mmetsp:Transcript_42577/g.89008  ORF Transcript_42577/g.89008 Transcript_42577/m.89008 type:complete len:204 (-) Transcript_42577:895-1506(-)